MKPVLILAVCLILVAILGVKDVQVSYKYDREIGSYWSLADKASTIAQKSDYIEKYVAALDSSGAMHGNNAIIFTTPDNDLEKNMEALRSLSERLKEIRKMDVSSFAYQQAIQQITAQEQGEAKPMLAMLEGGWLLHGGYWYLWDWIEALLFISLIGVVFVCAAWLHVEFGD